MNCAIKVFYTFDWLQLHSCLVMIGKHMQRERDTEKKTVIRGPAMYCGKINTTK